MTSPVRGSLRAIPMAAAAVELAESYQRQSRAYLAFMRWAPVFLVFCFAYLAISAAVDGNHPRLIFSVLGILWSVGTAIFSPAVRPKNMGRSLEASRRVIASSG